MRFFSSDYNGLIGMWWHRSDRDVVALGPSGVSSETRRALPVTVPRRSPDGPNWVRSVVFEWAARCATRPWRKALAMRVLPKGIVGGAGAVVRAISGAFCARTGGRAGEAGRGQRWAGPALTGREDTGFHRRAL